MAGRVALQRHMVYMPHLQRVVTTRPCRFRRMMAHSTLTVLSGVTSMAQQLPIADVDGHAGSISAQNLHMHGGVKIRYSQRRQQHLESRSESHRTGTQNGGLVRSFRLSPNPICWLQRSQSAKKQFCFQPALRARCAQQHHPLDVWLISGHCSAQPHTSP